MLVVSVYQYSAAKPTLYQSTPKLKCVERLNRGEEFYRDMETEVCVGEMRAAVRIVITFHVIHMYYKAALILY